MAAQASTRAFREFPPEIREMIYAYSLRKQVFDRKGRIKTPALLAALRGDSELYTEALHYYYAHNETVIHRLNFQNFDALNSVTWRSIRRLTIKLPISHGGLSAIRGFFEDKNSKLRLAENVETFHVAVYPANHLVELAKKLIAQCAWNSQRLRSVEVDTVVLVESQSLALPTLIDSLNSGFINAIGKLRRVRSDIWGGTEWIWKAEGNDLLELSRKFRLRRLK